MMPSHLYGLRIIPLSGEPAYSEWVSCVEGKAEERAERLSRYLPPFLFGVESTPVTCWEYGWYATDQPHVFARVFYRDSKIVKGVLYRLDKERTHYLDIRVLWYLNGESVLKGFPQLLRKAKYEDHHGIIRNPG